MEKIHIFRWTNLSEVFLSDSLNEALSIIQSNNIKVLKVGQSNIKSPESYIIVDERFEEIQDLQDLTKSTTGLSFYNSSLICRNSYASIIFKDDCEITADHITQKK